MNKNQKNQTVLEEMSEEALERVHAGSGAFKSVDGLSSKLETSARSTQPRRAGSVSKNIETTSPAIVNSGGSNNI